MSDEGVTIPEEFVPDLQEAVDFVRNHGMRILQALSQPPERNQVRLRYPARAILLQDLYESGYALASIIQQVDTQRSFLVSVLGVNFVPESKFRLKVSLVNGMQTAVDELGTTEALNANASTEEVYRALLAIIPFLPPDQLYVSIGNPYTSADLVRTAEIIQQSNLEDFPDATPLSYVGCWLIQFAADIRFPRKFAPTANSLPPQFLIEIAEETADVRMKGLSAIAVRKLSDIDTNQRELVWDCIGIAKPTPLKAGVTVALIDFPGSGYGVIGSGYRDMSVDIQDDAEFVDPPPEEDL